MASRKTGDWFRDAHNKRSLKGASIRDLRRRRDRRRMAEQDRRWFGELTVRPEK